MLASLAYPKIDSDRDKQLRKLLDFLRNAKDTDQSTSIGGDFRNLLANAARFQKSLVNAGELRARDAVRGFGGLAVGEAFEGVAVEFDAEAGFVS